MTEEEIADRILQALDDIEDMLRLQKRIVELLSMLVEQHGGAIGGD